MVTGPRRRWIIRVITLIFLLGTLAQIVPAQAGKHHRNDKADTKITDGFNVANGNYKFIASIQLKGTVGPANHFCTGSLIRNNKVLTAAHCFFANDATMVAPGAIQVVIGRTNLSQTFAPEAICPVVSYQVHPNYIPGKSLIATSGRYDVAIVNLGCTVTAMQSLPKGMLAPTSTTPEGLTLIDAGWGCIQSTGTPCASPAQMQWAQFGVTNQTRCANVTGLNGTAIDQVICLTGNGYNGAKNSRTCVGDSGSPAFKVGNWGNFEIYGTVSWGPILQAQPNCTDPNSTTVYPDLTYPGLRDWIVATAGLKPPTPTEIRTRPGAPKSPYMQALVTDSEFTVRQVGFRFCKPPTANPQTCWDNGTWIGTPWDNEAPWEIYGNALPKSSVWVVVKAVNDQYLSCLAMQKFNWNASNGWYKDGSFLKTC